MQHASMQAWLELMQLWALMMIGSPTLPSLA